MVRSPRSYFVYIMTNDSGTLYTGITNNLLFRAARHKRRPAGFAKKYRTSRLVYYEETGDVLSAIAREKQIKGWLRSRKINLVNSMNPEWKDLARDELGR
jgi:putative endonuclease